MVFGADSINPVNAPMKEWIDTGNTANKLLCATIGDPGGTGLFGCTKSETVLHPIFKVFALAVMSISALFMFWNVVSGTMTSAQDGEFMGKRTSSTWAPLRVTMGWAMLIPAFGGFNLAQLVMVWATAVGVGIAGFAQGYAAKITSNTATRYTVPTNLLKADDLSIPLREKTVCVARWMKQTKNLKDAGSLDTEASNVRWNYTIDDSRMPNGLPALLLRYGAIDGDAGYMPDECGTVRVPLPDPNAYGNGNDPGTRSILTAVGNAMRVEICQ